MRLLLLSLLFSLAMAAASQAQDAAPAAPAMQAHTFEGTMPVRLRYLLYLPQGYDAPDAEATEWPLVLFLHGAGERGDDLARVAVHGPPRQAAAGRAFPFILVAPQLQADRPRWEVPELKALLDDLLRRYRVDPARVYLTGLSMGGYGTWDLAVTHPELFAAIAPVCGGGNPRHARFLKDVPTWAFHGALDTVIPLERSAEMVRALREAGGDVRLTVYPEAGHDAWTPAYDDPAFYDWLLRHRR